MKTSFLNWGLLLTLSVAFLACSDDNNCGVEKDIPDTQPAIPVKAEGFYVVNEGGIGRGLESVMYITKSGAITYKAYLKANGLKDMGSTTTQFGTFYGDNLYLVSKQGNRLVVADAKTLKQKAVLEDIGSDGRTFQGINTNKGYIGLSGGVAILDLKTNTVGGYITDGILGYEEVGDMCLVGTTVFASVKNKVLVIDTNNDEIIKTLELSGANSVLLGRDGNVWAGAGGSLYKINPETLESKKIDHGFGIRTNEWAWTARAIDASNQTNTLYWASGRSVIKFDMETETASKLYDIEPDRFGKPLEFYGSGLRVDPMTDQIALINLRSWWGEEAKFIWIRLIDNQGNKLQEYPILSDGYDKEVLNEDGSLAEEGHDFWFPAMPLFQDLNAPEIRINQITLNSEESVKIDLNEKIADPDNLLVGITKSIAYDETEGMISAELEGQNLVVKSLGKKGVTELKLSINSNGKIASKNIKVLVK